VAESSTNPSQIENLFPTDSVPEVRMGTASGVEQKGWSPRQLTGLFRTLLGHYFSDPQLMANPHLRRSLMLDTWRETLLDNRDDLQDENPQTGVLVESTTRWRPERSGNRPALLIHAQDWTWQRVGINNQQSTNTTTGELTFEGQWIGAHTVFAVSAVADEAQMLGYEAGGFLQVFAPTLSREYAFSRLEVSRIGQVAAFEGHAELFAVPIDLPYIVPFAWTVQLEAPRFQRLRMLLAGGS